MMREEGEKNPQKAAENTRKEINPENLARSEGFFNAPAKEKDPEAIEKHMPWPGGGVKKLKCEQLPNSAMEQSIEREAKVFVRVEASVKEQNALNNKGDYEHHD